MIRVFCDTIASPVMREKETFPIENYGLESMEELEVYLQRLSGVTPRYFTDRGDSGNGGKALGYCDHVPGKYVLLAFSEKGRSFLTRNGLKAVCHCREKMPE